MRLLLIIYYLEKILRYIDKAVLRNKTNLQCFFTNRLFSANGDRGCCSWAIQKGAGPVQNDNPTPCPGNAQRADHGRVHR